MISTLLIIFLTLILLIIVSLIIVVIEHQRVLELQSKLITYLVKQTPSSTKKGFINIVEKSLK